MNETSKCYELRQNLGHFDKYLKGNGIDIGSGNDLLQIPNGNVRGYDVKDGDANYCQNLGDSLFDFVYSSHCLEHMKYVKIALSNWSRILRTNGSLYVVVPDFELYEKKQFPSKFNGDHKQTFSLNVRREEVGRNNHHHLIEMSNYFNLVGIELLDVQLQDMNYDYSLNKDIDQTRETALAQICFIGRKKGGNGT